MEKAHVNGHLKFQNHLTDFVNDYNFTRRLKSLNGTPSQICIILLLSLEDYLSDKSLSDHVIYLTSQ